MYLKSNNKEECCGCTACMCVCPKSCITMKRDKYGFSFPVIDKEMCVSCGLCEKVCPLSTEHSKKKSPICYYGWHRDEETRSLSTSGAAFTAIAQIAVNLGYTSFYGAAYQADLSVAHVGKQSIEELNKLRCSKYVQSELNGIYKEIQQRLRNGEKVLFSGTPCQVDGLQKFLGNVLRQNLLTVALVCHGVTSPAAFEKYQKDLQKRTGEGIQSIRFRDKRLLNGKLSHRFTTIKLSSGQILADIQNPYTITFGLGLMHRDSCFQCPYTTPERDADISIGDFWGIEKYIPALSDEISKGISLILIHSENGKKIAGQFNERLIIHEVPLQYALNPQQQQLLYPMKRNSRRDSFLLNVLKQDNSFEKLAKKEISRWKKQIFCKRIVWKMRKLLGALKR